MGSSVGGDFPTSEIEMDGQKSLSKLSRTQSSLLRSSPTVRSSIQSLTSTSSVPDTPDLEEQKPHAGNKQGPKPVRAGLGRVIAVLILSLYTVFLFCNDPTSENLLMVLICVAVLLFLVLMNKSMVNQNLVFCKHWCDKCGKRLNLWRFSGFSKSHDRPVQWFIGEPYSETEGGKGKSIATIEQSVEEGVEFYSNGDFYEGEFHRGRCNGSGVYNYFAKGRYEGDWVDGRYDGYGIESWAKGSRYKGQYRQGLRHGFGVYKFFTGDSYAGEWCNGQSHGVGMQTCADGSCYVGEFKRGVKHGLGCYHFRNGDRYSGEYFTDKPQGFGIYHFSNGHCYEGSWHEGRKQGYGMYTFSNGESQCGEWDCGVLKATLSPQNQAIVRAVQAARETSENAVHIRRIEQQVNNVVMAANRAATAARVAAVKAVHNGINRNFCEAY